MIKYITAFRKINFSLCEGRRNVQGTQKIIQDKL